MFRKGLAFVGLVICVVLTAGAEAASGPAPLEPVKVKRVPLPDGVNGMSEPRWHPDGRHLVVGFSAEGSTGEHAAVVRPDGSGFRCLTCGLEQVIGLDRPLNATRPFSVGKPFPFDDGKRVLLRLGGRSDRDEGVVIPVAGETQDFNYGILECEPSILRCDERRIAALELPGGGLTRGVQNREARISPDNQVLAWTEVQLDGTRMSIGRLVDNGRTYTVDRVRVLNPAFELGNDPRGWQLGSPLYELKEFTPDGQGIYYASFASAENYDDFQLDLRTGERRRLTRDLEWQEGIDGSPDGSSIVIGGSHGRDRMAPFAIVPRPTYIDFPAYVLIGRFQLSAPMRTCLLEPWLMDSGGQRRGYFGQPLNVDQRRHWGSHGPPDWSSLGNRVAFWERNPANPGTNHQPAVRVVVATLPARGRGPDPDPKPTPLPAWAPARSDWDGYHNEQRYVTLPGAHSGSVTIRLTGIVNTHDYEATYVNYSDDGRLFIEGTEAVQAPFTIAYGRWIADLTVSGERTGHLRADVTVRTGGRAQGTLSSRLGKRVFEGLPESECDPIPLPRLKGRVLGGGRVKVVARPLADPRLRPVRAARVARSESRSLTNANGIAKLPRDVDPIGARVTASGFRPGVVR